tara:strand:+ start:6728 stop:7159 length:432 start_codon:yes stop_codon:yes gene_type:complete
MILIMRNILALAVVIIITFSSCGTYDISTSYKIKSILTITEKGDTLAVPVRDFKFRILDNRIREFINRDPYRYNYNQNWQHRNWNHYSVPNINVRSTNSPPVIYQRPITVPITKPVRPVKPVKPIRIVTPVGLSKENKINNDN